MFAAITERARNLARSKEEVRKRKTESLVRPDPAPVVQEISTDHSNRNSFNGTPLPNYSAATPTTVDNQHYDTFSRPRNG